MMFKTLTVATALATLASAQRPSNTTICDYYTTALLMNNTAANQMTLLTLVVNTAVIGNCTSCTSLTNILLFLSLKELPINKPHINQ